MRGSYHFYNGFALADCPPEFASLRQALTDAVWEAQEYGDAAIELEGLPTEEADWFRRYHQTYHEAMAR